MTQGKSWLFAIMVFLACIPGKAGAEIRVAFYSHELGSSFPHAFFTVNGTTSQGEPIDTNFGFTAKSVTPAILMGSVAGKIEHSKPAYVKASDRQFEIKVSETQYRALIQLVDKWRNLPGKSYNLNRRNCIHFVGEAAQLLGLKVSFDTSLLKRPRSFLQRIKALNPGLLP